MSKLIVLLLVAFLSALIIAPIPPRHLNPQQIAPELPSKFDLLALYGSVIDAVLGGNFTYASENMKHLLRVYVPENVKYVYNRFNELLDKELRELNETNYYLSEGESELSQGFLKDAEKSLETAGRSLAEAELIHQELEDSSREMAKAVGVPLTELFRRVGKLKVLIKLYRDKLSLLSDKLKRLEEENILDTSLKISVDRSEVLIGSGIHVQGVLSAVDGQPLEGRIVSVYVDGKKVGELLTRGNGVFSGVVVVPYIYKSEADLFAEYVPSGGDLGRFKASRSNVVVLKLIYEVPKIDVSTNATSLLPLEALEVSGRVLTVSGYLPGEIYVRAFGNLNSVEVSEDGHFKLVLKVPGSAATGSQEILLYTKPHGILASARKAVRIIVYKIPVHLEVSAPAFAFSGARMDLMVRLSVEGKMDVGASVAGEIVLESFGRVRSFRVEGRTFLMNLSVPLTAFSGFTWVKLTFNPATPVYESSTAQVGFLTLNPLMILMPLSAVIYLTRIGIREISKRKRIISEVERGKVEAVGEIEAKLAPRIPREITGIYLEAVKAVEEMTGVDRRGSDTIREFLDKVEERLGDRALIFSELSYMVEAAVYGGMQPDLELARYLLDGVRRRVYEV